MKENQIEGRPQKGIARNRTRSDDRVKDQDRRISQKT
jgi:hypothetical protein